MQYFADAIFSGQFFWKYFWTKFYAAKMQYFADAIFFWEIFFGNIFG